MNKYVAEFIGTFFLILTIGCTVIGHGAGPFAPLAIEFRAHGDDFRGRAYFRRAF